MAGPKGEPRPNCRRCPRLAALRRDLRRQHPDWHNGPVRTWLPPGGANAVELLIIGLAPGLKGANRTGRAFTGDASGGLLLPMLERVGLLAGTGTDAQLRRAAITNAVRCLPPDNRPTGAEVTTCRTHHLAPLLSGFHNLRSILTLGKTAHEATVRSLRAPLRDHPFAHGTQTRLPGPQGPIALIASYHCSRYNVNTGRVNERMLADAIALAYEVIERPSERRFP